MASLTHWHILGAGSLGCLWAYYLAKAGHTVTLIARNAAQQKALHAILPITLIKGGKTYYSGNIGVTSPAELSNNGKPIRHLLVCLKAYQTADALSAIKPLVSNNATVVLMQNGMGNQQLLLDALPQRAVYMALTTEAACKRNILTVEHTGSGNTQLGALGPVTDPALPQKMACDLVISLHPDIQAALWQKLVVNCCINPLTVIYRCRNGALADNNAAQDQIRAIIHESRNVAQALGKQHYLDGIELKVAEVIEKTAQNTSSMLQDILQKRPTEIDYINGFISKTGRQQEIATPTNDTLVEQIKQGEHHA